LPFSFSQINESRENGVSEALNAPSEHETKRLLKDNEPTNNAYWATTDSLNTTRTATQTTCLIGSGHRRLPLVKPREIHQRGANLKIWRK